MSQSATVAAGGAALATAACADEHLEVAEWKKRVGSRFRVDDESLLLRSVEVSDHSADPDRPKELRPYSIALLFVGEHKGSRAGQTCRLQDGSQELMLTRVVPPEGETGAFYEGIIN